MRAVFLTTFLYYLTSAGHEQLHQCDAFMPAALSPVQAGASLSNSLGPEHKNCHAGGNYTDPVCIYSSHWFASTRGISIVTTSENMRHIERLPAFSNLVAYHSSTVDEQAQNPPFEERDLPGRGRGLIANRTLHRGDRILAHTPILIFHDDASNNIEAGVWAGLENDAIGRLPTPAKTLFWDLYGQPRHGPVGGRINSNAFAFEIKDTEHYVISPEIARINHDCRPNTAYFFDEATLTHYVHALTDIHPGTELTLTYIDPHMPRKERLETLLDTWGFNCSCSSCSMATHLSRESDARLAQIEEMVEDFDEEEETMSSSMALALISLYEQERLYGPLADAYRFAATAYCTEGDPWGAIKYASLAVEAGMLEDGFNDNDVKLMRRLRSAPEKQPCWPRAKYTNATS